MTKSEFLKLDEKSKFDWMIKKGWRADETGQVWSHKGKPVGSVCRTHAYIIIGLNFGRQALAIRAHRFVGYFFHRSLADTVDHINRDRSDNRLSNLRSVTKQQNHFNTKAKGYTFHKRANKWLAQITLNGKNIYLGLFDTKEEAHEAYLEAKKKYHII